MFSQTLDEKSGREIVLNNEIIIHCFLKSNLDSVDSLYYYIPTNIHFQKYEAGEKAYSILSYKGNNKNENGTIMHWILQWGLNPSQLTDATRLLRENIGGNSSIYNAVMVEWPENKDKIEIIGSNSLAQLLRKTLVNQSKTPLTPFGKSALAFKMDASDSESFQLLWTDDSQIKEVFIQMSFKVNFKSQSGSFFSKTFEINKNLKDLLQ